MLTAQQVQELIALTDADLTRAIRRAGYRQDTVYDAEFVGLTNGGQFAYRAHWTDSEGEELVCKVFATVNDRGQVVADY
jgi:hypothetical protein